MKDFSDELVFQFVKCYRECIVKCNSLLNKEVMNRKCYFLCINTHIGYRDLVLEEENIL